MALRDHPGYGVVIGRWGGGNLLTMRVALGNAINGVAWLLTGLGWMAGIGVWLCSLETWVALRDHPGYGVVIGRWGGGHLLTMRVALGDGVNGVAWLLTGLGWMAGIGMWLYSLET